MASRAAQALHVDGADVGHDAHLRSGDATEEADLAGAVHAHLQDSPLVVRAELEEGEGEPDLSVQIGFALEDGERAGQDGGGELFAGGLAEAAGDADDLQVVLGAPVGSQGLEGGEAIAHLEDGHVRRQTARQALNEDAGGAAGHGVGDKIVAVVTFAGQGDEQVIGLYLAGVDGDAGERPALVGAFDGLEHRAEAAGYVLHPQHGPILLRRVFLHQGGCVGGDLQVGENGGGQAGEDGRAHRGAPRYVLGFVNLDEHGEDRVVTGDEAGK